MARSYPIRAPCHPPRFNSDHRRLLSRIHSIQLSRNGLDLFRSLWNFEYTVRLPVHSWVEVTISELGLSRWVQRHFVLALPVSQRVCSRQELMSSASYLLILTYDKSAAAPDHITLTHFLGSLINPVPSISKSTYGQSFSTH